MTFKAITNIMLILFLASMITIPLNITSLKAEPTTLIVPDDYAKIQWAIGNATTGDTIFVRSGTYYENVVVNKSVSFIGENKYNTIIDGNGTGSVVYITATKVNITGFTIRNSGSTFPNSGILLEGSSDDNINQVVIINNKFGILLMYSCNSNLAGNIASNNIHGIELYDSRKNKLINNNASNNNCGILLHESDNNMFIGNTISDNNFGIVLGYSNNNMISNNTVSNGEWTGIRIVDHSNGNMLLNNTASNNLDGFELTYANNNTLINNIASHNRRDGIMVAYSDNNMLTGNTVSNNVHGIEVQSYSSNNSIYHNNLINNAWQAYIILSPFNTMWDDGYPSGGNYWSDYAGTDLFSGPYQNETGSDGIGDTPYAIDQNNTDNYPLMNPWAPTPVITATIDVDPDTLNLKSNGKWITCYIELPEGYNVSDIDVSTILLNDTVPAEWSDIQDNVLMVKFNRTAIISLLDAGNQTIKITGELADGTPFEGTDMIRAIHSEDNYLIAPEFPTWASMLPILIMLTVAVAIYKRRLLKTPIQ